MEHLLSELCLNIIVLRFESINDVFWHKLLQIIYYQILDHARHVLLYIIFKTLNVIVMLCNHIIKIHDFILIWNQEILVLQIGDFIFLYASNFKHGIILSFLQKVKPDPNFLQVLLLRFNDVTKN